MPPDRWSVSAGALPPGLKLNTTTSEVSGTPTKAGNFSFTLKLTDSKGVSVEQADRDHDRELTAP